MSNAIQPKLTTSPLPYRNDQVRTIRGKELERRANDPNATKDQRARAKKMLATHKRFDMAKDGIEGILGAERAERWSWPLRALAGLFKHPDISNKQVADRANAYLAGNVQGPGHD